MQGVPKQGTPCYNNKGIMIIRTNLEIDRTITAISKRLEDKAMSKACNAALKEGYTEALAILKEQRDGYEGIADRCHTIQGRAIAVLAVDFLRGECNKKVLCNVPLKK